MLSDEKYHMDEVSIAYCQSKDLERVFVRIVGKSLFIYPKTKCFSAFSCSSVFCIPPRNEMKCCHLSKKFQIHHDGWSRNMRRSSHSMRSQLKKWENCLSKLRRESERNYFAMLKEEKVTKLNNKSVKFNAYT